MATRMKLGVLVTALLVLTAVMGASAFTSGTVTRSANVNVVNDDAGLIALADGTSGDLVSTNSSGALAIDFTAGGAGGVNPSATYNLGDPNDPTNKSAFNVTNSDTTSHDLTFTYTGSDSEDGDDNLQFRIFDSTGAEAGTVSEETGTVTASGVGSGSTLYVVVTVNTHGLTSDTDLSGTLEVSA